MAESELLTPVTEVEAASLLEGATQAGGRAGMLLRRVLFERDRLRARVADLEAALRQFKQAWDGATSDWEGLTSKSHADLEAASELAGSVLGEG
jgi:hypothetical protein